MSDCDPATEDMEAGPDTLRLLWLSWPHTGHGAAQKGLGFPGGGAMFSATLSGQTGLLSAFEADVPLPGTVRW